MLYVEEHGSGRKIERAVVIIAKNVSIFSDNRIVSASNNIEISIVVSNASNNIEISSRNATSIDSSTIATVT